MRLTIIWRIKEICEGVGALADNTLWDDTKDELIIVLLFIQNNS